MTYRTACRLTAGLLAASLTLTGCSLNTDGLRSLIPGLSEESETETLEVSETAADAEDAAEETEDAEEETAVVSDTIQAQQAAVMTLSIEAGGDLNPFTSDSLANLTFLSLLYEGLFQVGPDFTAAPVICRDYTVSDDELTYAFALNPDVTFSDGTGLTASDVVYSLDLARSSAMYSARFEHIESITAASDYQVVITLSTPMEDLPLLLDIPIVRSGTGSSSSPVGTGPYQLSLSGDDGVLTPCSSWWQGKTQPFRRIELQSFSDGLAQRDQFEQGDLDLVVTDPSAVGAATYHSDYELWSQDTTIMQYLGFNFSSAIFSQQAVRSAMTYLLDRQTIVSEYSSSMALAAELPVNPNSSLYDTRQAANYSYDRKAFRKAIKATDLTDSDGDGVLELYGERMEGTLLVCADSTQRVEVAQYIADLLNEEGFAITVVSKSAADFETALANREYDLYYAEVRLTADFDLSPFFADDGALNYGGLADDEALQLCIASLENSGNFYNLCTKIMDEGLICPVLFKKRAVYTSRGAVSGLDPSPSSVFYDLENISCHGN
jgi:ABC-type transport system substrate-binding protein